MLRYRELLHTKSQHAAATHAVLTLQTPAITLAPLFSTCRLKEDCNGCPCHQPLVGPRTLLILRCCTAGRLF